MNEGITVVLVNPHHVKKSKELDDNLNRKTDRKDPKVIAGLVHEGRYFMPYLPGGAYANLRNLNNLRLMNTEEKTRCMNRLNRWLSIYFPEYGTVFKDVSGVGSLLLLEQVALPGDIVKLGADGINRIWRTVKLWGTGYSKALKIVSAAERSIGCPEGLDIAKDEIQWIVENLKVLIKWDGDLLARIETLARENPYIDNILEIKGLGVRTVVGILAEIGDISRFTSVKPIQKLAGLALVEDSSGKHEGRTIISKRSRKRLRYHLYQAALVLIGQNDEFRKVYDYYRTREDNPLKKMQALMAVACKLLRVLYAMVTKGVVAFYLVEKMRNGEFSAWKVLEGAGIVIAAISFAFILFHLYKRIMTSSMIAGFAFTFLFLAFSQFKLTRGGYLLQSIGRQSYGMYCFHQIIINCILFFVIDKMNQLQWIGCYIRITVLSYVIGCLGEKAGSKIGLR